MCITLHCTSMKGNQIQADLIQVNVAFIVLYKRLSLHYVTLKTSEIGFHECYLLYKWLIHECHRRPNVKHFKPLTINTDIQVTAVCDTVISV